jgi:hypothetical protein
MRKEQVLAALRDKGLSINGGKPKAKERTPKVEEGKAAVTKEAEDDQIPYPRRGSSAWWIAKYLLRDLAACGPGISAESLAVKFKEDGVKCNNVQSRLYIVTSGLRKQHKWSVEFNRESKTYKLK